MCYLTISHPPALWWLSLGEESFDEAVQFWHEYYSTTAHLLGANKHQDRESEKSFFFPLFSFYKNRKVTKDKVKDTESVPANVQRLFIEVGNGSSAGARRANTLMEDLGPRTYPESPRDIY